MSFKTVIASPDGTLMQALKFSSKDLDANRDGIATTAQKRRIKQNEFGCSVVGWGFVLLFGVAFLGANQPREQVGRWFILLLAGLTLGGIFVHQRMTFEMLKRGKVAAVRGLITKSNGKPNRNGQWIQALNKQFFVSDEAHAAFIEGEEYTLYHLLDYPYTILSAEYHEPPLPDPKAKPRHIANIQRRMS